MQLALPQIAAQNAIVLLTVEPMQGLANVTYAAIGTLAYYIKQFQQASALTQLHSSLVWTRHLMQAVLQGGGHVMVSFGQEMNGAALLALPRRDL